MTEELKLKIQLEGEFSASELDEIIRELAIARAGLLPAVTENPPLESSEENALVQSDAKFSIRRLADGGIRVWMRNDGLGWFAFTLSASSKESLSDFLVREISDSYTSH